MDLDKPVNQFLREMRDAGFDYSFTASNGKESFIGECKKNESGSLELKVKRMEQ